MVQSNNRGLRIILPPCQAHHRMPCMVGVRYDCQSPLASRILLKTTWNPAMFHGIERTQCEVKKKQTSENKHNRMRILEVRNYVSKVKENKRKKSSINCFKFYHNFSARNKIYYLWPIFSLLFQYSWHLETAWHLYFSFYKGRTVYMKWTNDYLLIGGENLFLFSPIYIVYLF